MLSVSECAMVSVSLCSECPASFTFRDFQFPIEELRDGYSPPDRFTEDGIRQMISIAASDLDRCRLEIAKLDILKKAIEENAQRISENIEAYRSLLSPIRSLPDDILAEIFNHRVSAAEESEFIFPGRRSLVVRSLPLCLGAVCRSWQRIVISSPRLWRRFFLNVPSDRLFDEKLHFFHASLQRIKAVPLEVDFCTSPTVWVEDLSFALRSILQTSCRITKRLSINTSTLVMCPEIFQRWSDKPQYPHLEDLSICLRGIRNDEDEEWLIVSGFDTVKGLKRLELLGSIPNSAASIFHLHELVDLVVMPSGFMRKLVMSCASLEKLTLVVYAWNSWGSFPSIKLNIHSLVFDTTPELREDYELVDYGRVLNKLILPNLNTLLVKFSATKIISFASYRNLLQRSQCRLTTLTLIAPPWTNTFNITNHGLVEFCSELHSLIELSLEGFAIPQSFIRSVTYGRRDFPNLLPKLQVLKLEKLYPSILDIPDILDFILDHEIEGIQAGEVKLKTFSMSTWHVLLVDESLLSPFTEKVWQLRDLRFNISLGYYLACEDYIRRGI